jgi:hypothetical protein
MKGITRQQLTELLKQKKIKVEDVFDFVEYLDQT